MSVKDTIRKKIEAALNPERLEVIDDSARHAGHAGSRPGGETHFRVSVVSVEFSGKNRVQRQRMVYDALKEEMAGPIHALEISAISPDEQTGG